MLDKLSTMIRYYPIRSGAPWHDADAADLRSFDWSTNTAEFIMHDDPRIVRVHFHGTPVIVRMIDEFPLSTESQLDAVGLVAHHFAYRVEGDPFFEAQSAAWKSVGSAKHYRFLTGAGCLDVVAMNEPEFQIAVD